MIEISDLTKHFGKAVAVDHLSFTVRPGHVTGFLRRGFLLKDAKPAELLDGIRVVAAGDAAVAPSVTRRLIESFANHLPADLTPVDERLHELTDREHEILTELARGPHQRRHRAAAVHLRRHRQGPRRTA